MGTIFEVAFILSYQLQMGTTSKVVPIVSFMNSTINDLVEYTLSLENREDVTDVRIGLGYTAVKLGSGKCGVACVLRHRLDSGGCSLLSQAGTLSGQEVSQLIPLTRSSNVVEASVGLAAINALAEQGREPSSQQDLMELLQITEKDRVGMIGCIEPLVRRIRQRTDTLFVFDEAKSEMEGLVETHEIPTILPQCHVVLLSATTLVNKTFDALMEMSSQAREICLLGPSTPLFSEFFQTRGITVLAGRQILDANTLLQIVSEAGGTRSFGEVTRKVNIVLR
jgi:uncharacterized protein (DUF4213/DUF364 family)